MPSDSIEYNSSDLDYFRLPEENINLSEENSNNSKGDKKVLDKLAASISTWVKEQATPVAINEIQDLFKGNLAPQKISPEQKKLEDKFKKENFDLINWFIISNK